MLKVLVIDDHAMVREGLRRLIARDGSSFKFQIKYSGSDNA